MELNCNLHPLEAVSNSTLQILAENESPSVKTFFRGNDCLAWKIIIGFNTLRYSGGNRINLIFHLGAIYFCNRQKFDLFLQGLENLNELKENLRRAFREETAIVEFQVLGIIGKLLSGRLPSKPLRQTNNLILKLLRLLKR